MRDKALSIYLIAVVTVIIWGFSYIWENVIISANTVIFTFIFERMLLAGVLLFVAGKATKTLQKVKKGDWKWLFLIAFSEPFIYFIGENFGLKETASPIVTSVIISTIPIFCIVLEKVVYKKPLSPAKTIGTSVTLPGIFLVVFEKGGMSVSHAYGLLLLGVSVAGAVSYTFFVERMSKTYNAMTITTWQFIFGALLFFPLFLIFGLKGLTPTFFSQNIQLTIIALAVLCSCVCFGLWATIIKKLGMTRANTFSALIPVCSAIIAFSNGQEAFSLLKAIGISIVVVGVVIAQRPDRSKSLLKQS